MTLLNKSYPVLKAVSHLANEAILTKSDGGSPLEAIARKFGDHTAATMEKLGATNQQIEGMKEQLAVLEQNLARGTMLSGGTYREKSIGDQVIESDELQKFAEKASTGRGKVGIAIKASITSSTANAAGSAGAGLTAHREPDLITLVRQRLTIRNLLPTIRIETGFVEIVKEAARNLNAGTVAEGASKPSSDLQLALSQVPIRTIAHWMKASRQILDDLPQVKGLIDTELLYGLSTKEESQLLAGDGVGQNLLGLIPQATAFSAPFTVTGTTKIDMIAQAICQLANAGYEVDGFVINTGDWWRMKTVKDAGGNYIIGNPSGTTGNNLWGLPAVPTTGITANNFLVGSFQEAATLYDRWTARVEVGYENDDFTKNMVTILAEERIGLAVKRPGALVYGSFGTV